MNEPRLGNSFSMNQLKAFYAVGSQAVREASGGKLTVTIHGEAPPAACSCCCFCRLTFGMLKHSQYERRLLDGAHARLSDEADMMC